MCVCNSMPACVVFQVLDCGGTAAVQCRWGEACMCLQCPAGQQPSKVTQPSGEEGNVIGALLGALTENGYY